MACVGEGVWCDGMECVPVGQRVGSLINNFEKKPTAGFLPVFPDEVIYHLGLNKEEKIYWVGDQRSVL